MSVAICPWCQSEIPQEEGQEPDTICPVCDNKMDGYRTLQINLGEDDEDEEDDQEEIDVSDDVGWADDETMAEKNEHLLQFEEAVEQLLDEQDFVPECPQCREYMLEAGAQVVEKAQFHNRVPESLGEAVLNAPFALTVYVCPSCFAVQTMLSEKDRHELARRIGSSAAQRGGKGNER